MALPGTLLRSLAGIVGEPHVLTGDATAGFAVDWTGRFRGQTPLVVRPRDTAEVAAVLKQLGPVDHEAAQVTAGAGVTLQQVADADPGLDLPILIASRDSATVGGAVATNAGGLRVLRFGPMRAQLRGIEAVLADGTVVSHLAGLVKDNTGYDYPSLLAGSEGTLAVITQARLRLVPRLRDTVTALVGVGGLDELHALARRAVREVPGLVSARRRRERAREHRPRGARRRASRGRGVSLCRVPRGVHLRRARHRGAQGTVASAGVHRRGTRAVRPDPFGVRSLRHAEPERSPALIRRPGDATHA
jgi:FAD/FMN-containing dehydrogenase